MFRTVGVLVGGMLLGVVFLGGLAWLTIFYMPSFFHPYSYYVLDALTGATVGLFVGFYQKAKAGLLALAALLPLAFWQYFNKYSSPLRGERLFLVLVGTLLQFVIAFVVAQKLSGVRGRAHDNPRPYVA